MDGSKKTNPFNIFNLSQLKLEAEATPKRKKLFGSFFYQDTNTLLFSRTNYGKSIIAFMVAYYISVGRSLVENKAFKNECKPMKVILYDGELDARELYDRHAPVMGELNGNFIYLNEKSTGKPLFGAELLQALATVAEKEKAKAIILDNITKILPDMLKADEVVRVIEQMKRIKARTGCSFLVIGHTTKGDESVCISSNSYYGSAHIQNFFQEIFYLDECQGGESFFLRHAKTKKQEAYINTVPVLLRRKIPNFGLGFEYQCLKSYADVKKPDTPQRGNNGKRRYPLTDFTDEISYLTNKGCTFKRIGDFANVSRQAVKKALES